MLKKTICAAVLMSAPLMGLTESEKLSQAFGHLVGKNLEMPGLTFDTEQVIQGIRDAIEGKESPMSEEEYEVAMVSLQEKAFQELADTNLNEAVEYLSSNAKKEGIVEAEAGKLQYEVVNSGSGKVVAEHATPTIHYTGKYVDGTVFGSSKESGEPLALPLDQTIPGFNRGIVGMKEGETRRIYIHPELGYGTNGQLPPNSLLIFDVEVISAGVEPLQEIDDVVAEVEVTEENSSNTESIQ